MTSTAHTIGTTVDIATIKADPNRTSLTIFNKHATATLYMKEGREVSVGNGIPIYSKGNVSLTYQHDGQTVRESWSLISDAVSTGVIIFEGS